MASLGSLPVVALFELTVLPYYSPLLPYYATISRIMNVSFLKDDGDTISIDAPVDADLRMVMTSLEKVVSVATFVLV